MIINVLIRIWKSIDELSENFNKKTENFKKSV